jgi:hypothetical protein
MAGRIRFWCGAFLMAAAFSAVADEAQERKPGFLGVVAENLTRKEKEELKTSSGARVSEVFEKSPAEAAGLKRNDVIQSVAGKKIVTAQELRRRIGEAGAGATVEIGLVRDGVPSVKAVRLEEKPSDGRDKGLRMHHTDTPWVGLRLFSPDDDLAAYFQVKPGEGALVLDVFEKSPAEKAGIRSGDVVVRIGRDRVFLPEDVQDLVAEMNPGDTISVAVIRQAKERLFKVTLEKRPFRDTEAFIRMGPDNEDNDVFQYRLKLDSLGLRRLKPFEFRMHGLSDSMKTRMEDFRIRAKELKESAPGHFLWMDDGFGGDFRSLLESRSGEEI